MKIQKTEYKLHSEIEWHRGIIIAVEPDEGRYGEQVRFDVKDSDNFILSVYASKVLNARSKLGHFVMALLGEIPDELDTDDLVGLDILFMVEHYTNVEGERREKIQRMALPQVSGTGGTTDAPSHDGGPGVDSQSPPAPTPPVPEVVAEEPPL